MEIKFYIIDVFTADHHRGNPAFIGVCNNAFPSYDQMLEIASEINFSNIGFVLQNAKNDFSIKWFTAVAEAPICGHVTLGACYALEAEGLIDTSEEILFESIAGNITAFLSDEGKFEIILPSFDVDVIDSSEQIVRQIESILGYSGAMQCFKSGNLFMMVLESADLVHQITPDIKLLSQLNCRGFITTAISCNPEYDFLSRYFAPRAGIIEDHACASAHCRLIPYWTNILKKNTMVAYQASARGGILRCKNLENKIGIFGDVKLVASGKWRLPEIKK